MKGGDIDGGRPPKRFLFVWEGLIATLPTENGIDHREWLALKMHRWRTAADLWVANPLMLAQVWDLWTRYDHRCDVVVLTRPPEFADAVRQRLDDLDYPVRRVFHMEAPVLARQLARMPDVSRVFFGDPSFSFTFGRKGVFVPDGGRDFSPMAS